jgi:magnesium transporter
MSDEEKPADTDADTDTDDKASKPMADRVNVILEKCKAKEGDPGQEISREKPDDIALALAKLEPEQADRLLSALSEDCAAEVVTLLEPNLARDMLTRLDPPRFKRMLEQLTPREAARVAADAPAPLVEGARAENPEIVQDAERRACYPPGSAGRLMTSQFLRLRADTTVRDALAAVRGTDPKVDTPDNLYVVEPEDADEEGDRLLGVVSIRALVMAQDDEKIQALMSRDVITVAGDADDDDAAALLSDRKFSTLPVVNGAGHLVGVIPSEDLMRVIVARLHRRYARAVGTDAQAIADASPLQEARLRVPWLLGTMVLELGAGVVIAHFNNVLEKIILLASFRPVISAVAGNVGLQAAAITVRGLDSGQVSFKRSGKALLKETTVTLLMGAACALVLGTIGVIWSKHLMFGIVIAIALGCSMLTACLMGTIIPMVSKKLGFDPATTAGPFETAFQDIIGFGVFLGLATLLLR